MKSTALSNIHVSGGLLSEHFIRLMREDTCSFVYAQPDTFFTPSNEDEKPPTKGEYDRKVAQGWANLKERWDIYGHKLTELDPADARRLWTKPLLEALEFDLVPLHKHVELRDQLKLKFSHRGWGLNPKFHNPPIVHIVPPPQGLDARAERGKPSPHDAVQEYLNRHDDLWALVTNGLYLRLLRDYHHTYVKGYVEFDLEATFITRSFRDFQALYRIAHASRFTSAETGNLYLEEYFQHSQLVGEKVGAKLRENVVRALMSLGNGFLDDHLLTELQFDDLKCHHFYEELLRVIYRIIFLLYAEQRGMLSGKIEGLDHDLYVEEYSMSALRELALTCYRKGDLHVDLWMGLRNTFEMLRHGAPELGIYPYGGMLFDTDKDEHVVAHGCKNSALLEAVYYLTTTEIDGAIHRISYADIDVEEIGAIYEGLLENTPRVIRSPESINGIEYPANSFVLDPRGLTRRTTGSYYTQRALIHELIRSALEPVINDRLQRASDLTEQEQALLSIKVCDPACGSGAFLLAACNRLAAELARTRAQSGIPTDDQLQQARREILRHCIYGVDLNPMAIELVKVSLWINALVKDKPLSFLDHHLKCGNSVIGATRELVEKGIRTAAFDPIEGDNDKVVNEVRRINKIGLSNASLSKWEVNGYPAALHSENFAALNKDIENSPGDVEAKSKHYRDLVRSTEYFEVKALADLWTGSFFWPLKPLERGGNSLNNENAFPTQQQLTALAERGSKAVSSRLLAKSNGLARRYSFFHWYLEFPDVFGRANSGFDCVLGNPPWERIKIQEKEFFQHKAPAIADARTAAERKKRITALVKDDPVLSDQFREAKLDSERESKFLRNSGRFALTGKGDINTYAVFSEHAVKTLNKTGRAGIIVPSGIATDKTTAEFFKELVDNRRIVSLYDFENRKQLFPIESKLKFCLLTLAGSAAPMKTFDAAFFLLDIDDLNDGERHVQLSSDDLNIINPNTQNCPVLRSKRDAELIKRIHRRIPVLVDDARNQNPWSISTKTCFHMTNDSAHFKTAEMLRMEGFKLEGNSFKNGTAIYVPLYEGKMIWIYNHRLSSMPPGQTPKDISSASLIETTTDQLRDFSFWAVPRYWVNRELVSSRLSSTLNFLIGYRGIAVPTNQRTAVFSIIPYAAVGNSITLILFDRFEPSKAAALLANMNTLVFDYVVRQKVGGANLNAFILKQLPVLPPTAYTDELTKLITPKVLELCYTAWDVQGFAKDLGYVDATNNKPLQPFQWDENRRLHLQAELDAIYAHLYGISLEDLAYVLHTFPIVKRDDVKKFGAYRTKELILKYYDEYAGKITPVEKLVPYDRR